MLEIVTTRANPMIDPPCTCGAGRSGLPVPRRLGRRLDGAVGVLPAPGRRPGARSVGFVLPWLGLVLLSLGMGALFLDLEHKLYVWRMYLTFQPASPMSWGGWILILVYPFLALAALASIPDDLLAGWPAIARFAARVREPAALRRLGSASMAVGIALGIYTGILLSTLGARPLWATAALGPLFLVSGLSTGAAFAHLIARDPDEQATLLKADNAFLGVELALIGLMLIGLLTASAVHADAARLLLGGSYTAVFWVLVVASASCCRSRCRR